MAGLDRAITDSCDTGFVKVLTRKDSDKIVGVSIVGAQAINMIAEFVSALKLGYGLSKILGTVHVYPTMAEANKYAAGVWRKNHKPKKVLSLLQKYFSWRRGKIKS